MVVEHRISSKDSEDGRKRFSFSLHEIPQFYFFGKLWYFVAFQNTPWYDHRNYRETASPAILFNHNAIGSRIRKLLASFQTHSCHGDSTAALGSGFAAMPAVDEYGTCSLCGARVVAKRTAVLSTVTSAKPKDPLRCFQHPSAIDLSHSSRILDPVGLWKG